ncbi:MAG: hypothetical protein ACI39U_04770 [Candidatus Cryptobacteroides sp.]
MRHKTTILVLAMLTVLPQALRSQDGRNQTVVVTNKYSFDSSGREKKLIEMAAPDSLNVFEKSFSYTVFDKPYSGAYEFHPYNLDIRPESGAADSRKFWMNAGIGYSLYPEFDLVYEPVRGPRSSFGIYARHRSFAGDYRKLEIDGDGLMRQLLDGEGNRGYYSGWNYDMDNEGGLDFCYDWERTGLSLTAAYKGLQQRDWLGSRSFDRAAADMKIYSKRQSSKVFNYSFYLSYQFGRDYVAAADGNTAELHGHDMKFGFSFVANMKKKGHFALDAGADVSLFANAMSHTAYVVEFLPQYVWEQGPWFVKAGIRVDIPAVANSADPKYGDNGNSSSQYVYPELMFSYECRNIPLNIYLNVTGGERLRSYSAVVDDYRHFNLLYRSAGIPVLRNEVERVDAEFGLRGSIRSVFSYNLSVSYAEKASLALESINYGNLPLRTGETVGKVPFYSITYADAGQLDARAEAEYADDWGSVGLKLLYTNLYFHSGVPDSYVAPAALTGSLDVKFNLMRRLYFGVGCDFSTPRQVHCGSSDVPDFKLPAYGDPYLSAEYLCNRMLSVWLRASRFTGQTIFSAPLYSERGPRVTAGLSLSF